MTKVYFYGPVKGWSGKMGKLIFRQMPDGSTVVSREPEDYNQDFSEKQLDHQGNFKESTIYAKKAQTDPIYVELAARRPGRTAYNIALGDWWHAPEIQRVERQEGRILVEATDDVKVARVWVTILDEDGKVLEGGEATRGEGDCWEFASQVQGKTIRAEAWDLPGHKTKFVL